MPPPVETTAIRVRRRAVRALALAAAVALLLFIVVWLQLLSRQGLGRIVYGLHDAVFLPLEGYTYTLFFPTSLVWWLGGGLLLGLVLFFWLTHLSPTRRPHVWALRRILRQGHLLPPLLRTVTLLQRLGLQPGMVRAIAHDEWERTALALSGDGRAQGRRLADLTWFTLALDPPRTPNTNLDPSGLTALGRWSRAYVLLHAYADQPATWIDRIADAATWVLPPPSDMARGAALTMTRVVADLRRTLEWGRLQWGQGGSAEPERPAELLESVEARRRELYGIYAAAEDAVRLGGGTPLLPAAHFTPSEAPALGQLALDVALHVALFQQSVAPASAYLDALDSLLLPLRALPDPVSATWLALLGGQTPAEAYRLVAELERRRWHLTDTAWQFERDSDTPVVEATDFALAEATITGLRAAAGPLPDGLQPGPIWPSGRSFADRAERAVRHLLPTLRLRQRLDAVLISGLLLFVASLLGLVGGSVFVVNRAGWLDRSVLAPLADGRKLVNVRDDLATRALLDAVFHPPDGRVYIAQAGGVIHRYDPRTELWSTERPFGDEPAADFVLLRSGCGVDSAAPAATSCAEADSLWAVGADGTLARRVAGEWQTVVSHTAFLDAAGQPIANEALTAAAVSDDGRWLALGTAADGIGLYDLPARRWVPAEAVNDSLPDGLVSQLVYWHGRFWAGTPSELVAIAVGHDGATTTTTVAEGRVIDLTVDAADAAAGPAALWVAAERPCANDDARGACLWLGRFDSPDDPAQTVIDEGNAFSDLSLATVNHAQQWDNRLALAGQAGIFTYDPGRHSWERLWATPVEFVLAEPERDGFYFGYQGGAGLVTAAWEVVVWEIAGETVLRLARWDDNVLALSANGHVYRLTVGQEPAQLLARGGGTLAPVDYTAALAAGDVVVFVGVKGGLIHHVRERTYVDLAAESLPDWLIAPTTRFVSVGAWVYVLSQGNGSATEIRALAADDMADPTYFRGGGIDLVAAASVPAAVAGVWPWPPEALGVLTSDGRVYRATSAGVSDLIGPRVQHDVTQFRDVAQTSTRFYGLEPTKLAAYSLAQRAWVQTDAPALAEDESFMEMAALGQTLFFQTNLGRLLAAGSDEALIGDATGFSMAPALLSDALLEGDRLLMAGDGRIDAYDLDRRRIVDRWQTGDSAAIALKGVVGGQPLALSDQIAYLGDEALSPAAGPVIGLSYADPLIWTVRRGPAGAYVLGQPPAGDAVCYFRQPATPEATALRDARDLPDGSLVAVATDAGLRFYRPEARRWYRATPNPLPDGGRVYLVAGHLIFLAPDRTGVRLEFARYDALDVPDSCADEPIGLTIANTVTARAAAVSESTGRVAWIDPNGAVVEWTGGVETQLLAPTGATAIDRLRRVFQRGDELLFTTDDGLRRYQLDERGWQSVNLIDVPSGDINIEAGDDSDIVTLRAASGDLFMGSLASGAANVTMQPLFTPPSATFDAAPGALVDAQSRADGVWTFLLRDRIRYYDTADRAWSESASFDGALPVFQQALGRGVVVVDGGAAWHVANVVDPHPDAFAAYLPDPSDVAAALDSDGRVWRLRPDGSIWRCAPAGSDYECVIDRPAAFQLDPAAVRHSFEWAGKVLFATTDGLRAYDHESGDAVALSPAATGFSDVRAAFQHGDHLVLYNGRALMLIDETFEQRVWDDARNVLIGPDGLLWADLGGVWQRYTSNTFVAVATSSGGVRLSLYVLPGDNVAALGEDGHPYSARTGRLGGANLEFEPDPRPLPIAAPDWLIRGQGEEWWAIDDGQLIHLVASQCLAPMATPTPAPSPTATLTPAATATPAPTATPVLVDCLVVARRVSLAIGTPRRAEARGTGGIALWGDNGAVVIDAAGGYTVMPLSDPTRADLALDDSWPARQAEVATLTNGRSAFDPVLRFDIDPQSKLLAVRPVARPFSLATRGVLAGATATPFAEGPALDAGWLQWDRAGRVFVLSTPTGETRLSPSAFIRDRQLIVERVDVVLALSETEIYAASPYGVLRYDNRALRPDDPQTRYYSLPPGVAITGAAHSHFLTGNGRLQPDSAGLSSRPAGDWAVNVDDATFTEVGNGTRIRAQVIIGGQPVSALTPERFVWDADRRALAYDSGTLLIQSDAGIGPLATLSEFDPGPGGRARTTATLYANESDRLFLRDGNQWLARDNGTWAPATDPQANRPLLANAAWRWEMRAGALVITLTGDNQQLRLVTVNEGLGFSADRLRAAAAYEGALYVVSDAFLEIARPAAQLGGWAAARRATLAADRLESVPLAGGGTALYLYADTRRQRWDEAAATFVPDAGSDPLLTRALVSLPFLRLDLQNSRLTQQLRLTHVGGGSQWVPFSLVQGRFPFDVVTSLAAADEQLFVGTAAGLEVFDTARLAQPGRPTNILSVRPSPTSPPPGVVRVGLPAAATDATVARAVFTDDSCMALPRGGAPTACAPGVSLADRQRVTTPFWRWVKPASGEAVGRYVLRGGEAAATTIAGLQGWPHDVIAAASTCQGQVFTLWPAGMVSVFDGAALTIDDQTRTDDLRVLNPARFVCLAADTTISTQTTPAGLYLLMTGGQARLYDAGVWREVAAATAADLRAYVDAPPAYQAERLRLTPAPDGVLVFQQRGLDNTWRALPWQDGRVVVDQWADLVVSNDLLWAATPAGLTQFTLSPDSARLTLDPTTVRVIREPIARPAPPVATCPVSDMRLSEGRVQVRCAADSAQVYEAELDGSRDRGLFTTPLAADPFATRPLIPAADGGFWRFDLVGRVNGNPGSLQARLGDQELLLNNGHFSFDTIGSLAFFRLGLVELGTTAGGWYQAPTTDLSVGALVRPPLAEAVGLIPEVHLGRDAGEAVLCLRTAGGGFVRLRATPDQTLTEDRATQCAELQAAESIWQYEVEQGRLAIRAPDSRGGVGQRLLQEGRFNDDIIVGLPLTGVASDVLDTAFYLVPTSAGVVRWSAGLQAEQLYAGQFRGLPPATSPTVVTMIEHQPAYLGEVGLHWLEGTRDAVAGLAALAPEGAEVLAIDNGPPGLRRVRWQDGAGRHWSYVAAEGRRSDNLLPVDVTALSRYRQRQAAWDVPGWVEVAVGSGAAQLLFGGRAMELPLPDDFVPVETLLADDRALLIGRQALLEINLEPGMLAVMEP